MSHLAGCAAAELRQLLPEAGVGVGDGPDGSDGIQHLLAAQLRDNHDIGNDHGGTAGDASEAGEEGLVLVAHPDPVLASSSTPVPQIFQFFFSKDLLSQRPETFQGPGHQCL